MARDLIPPSSPAPRPAAGRTPNLIELPPEPPEHLPPSEFRNRFGFLLGVLAGIFIATVLATALVVSTREDDGLHPNWSAWQPTDTSVEGGAAQIAAKVEPHYRLSDGDQLVHVTGGPLDLEVALRASTGSISVFDNPGVLYRLDGLGPGRSIKNGERSAERLKLLQRQALELALYTFRYLPDVEQVVTLLPPPTPTQEELKADEEPVQRAIYYRPGDLKPQLQMPLDHTITPKLATPDNLTGIELEVIDLLTQSNLFTWSLPDRSRPFLVLDHPS